MESNPRLTALVDLIAPLCQEQLRSDGHLGVCTGQGLRQGALEVKSHAVFRGVNFAHLLDKTALPPFVPLTFFLQSCSIFHSQYPTGW